MIEFLHQNPIVLKQPKRIVEPYSWVEHIPFAFYIISILKPKVLVELGVHTGNSFNAFCQCVDELHLETKCYGIDLWQGDEHAGFYDNKIYSELLSYQTLHYPEIGILIKMDFNDAAKDFKQNIDLLHIDGLHTYEAVKNDFETWLPHMSGNGVILFHDTQVREKGFGVYLFWEQIKKQYPHSFDFPFGNGLGVLLVGDQVSIDFVDFIKCINQDLEIESLFEFFGKALFNKYELEKYKKLLSLRNQHYDTLKTKYDKKEEKLFYLLHPQIYLARRSKILTAKTISLSYWERKYKKIFRDREKTYRYKKPNISDLDNTPNFSIQPTFSIVMPTFNTPVKWLKAAIDSVINQSYIKWELCIADDASTNIDTLNFLKSINEEKIKVSFNTVNGGISVASNAAIEMSIGEYIVLLDHDDELTVDALGELVKEINNSNADFIYSDEDKIDEKGNCTSPHFKPDFSSERLLSQNYICHLACIKKSLLQEVGPFRKGYEGSQDHDLFLRVTEQAKLIKHIPKVLYHWRAIKGSTALNLNEKGYAFEAGRLAVESAMQRRRIAGKVSHGIALGTYRVERDIIGLPLVSIIIPFKDEPEVLNKCLDSIISKSSYNNYEIIAVSNNSVDDRPRKIVDGYKTKFVQIYYLEYNHPFNYSEINNFAVNTAKGEHIILLNNDIEIISPDWIESLLQFSQIENVGAVGAKLLYPNDTIQHAGVIVGINGVAGHSHKYFPADNYGYFGRLILNQNMSAVTAACLMVKKKLYNKINGLNEIDFKVAFNDIDFCLRLAEAGYSNIYTPYCIAYHHESLSRGYEDNEEKKGRFDKECENLKARHKKILLEGDPFYNKNLTLEIENFSLK